MFKNMIAMLRDDEGATMVEYGIMVALICRPSASCSVETSDITFRTRSRPSTPPL